MLTTIALEDTQPPIKEPIPGLYKSKDGDGLVLLVSGRNEDNFRAIVVCSSAEYQVGTFDDDWHADCFEPFYGTISLKQTR